MNNFDTDDSFVARQEIYVGASMARCNPQPFYVQESINWGHFANFSSMWSLKKFENVLSPGGNFEQNLKSTLIQIKRSDIL